MTPPDKILQLLDLATEHHLAGQLREAELLYRELIARAPLHADALHQLGLLLWEKNELASALAMIEQAITLRPSESKYYCSRGQVLTTACQFPQALLAFQKALELKPDSVDSLFGLALSFQETGQLDQAIENYRKVLQHDPLHAEASNNLGNALVEKHQFKEAIAALGKALNLQPESAEKWYNLGNALREDGQLIEAVAAYRKAIKFSPEYLSAYINLANLLMLGFSETEEPLQLLHHALLLKPDNSLIYRQLGDLYKACGQIDKSLDCYRKAIELDPTNVVTHANFVFMTQYHPGYDRAAILRETLKFNKLHAQKYSLTIQPHTNDKTAERRLRIGYLSPNFRIHCQSFFTIPFLSNHDHERFDIFCYSDVKTPDALTEQISSYADTWLTLDGLSDAQVAERLRADQIDILVDLTMYMDNCRPLLFARKPAPIQVTYLAYPGTTGLSAMDYRLTDPYLDPSEDGDIFYSERSMRLPDSFWCYDPLTQKPPPGELPAFRNGFVTFGCLNNFCKVTESMLHLWGKCLQGVPHSRLILLSPKGSHRKQILNLFGLYGVDPERIEFCEQRPRQEYLETYRRIDICLDTLPYNGHTTSLDAFWMGVPVVTLIGKTVVGRAGLSLLSNLHLRALAAETEQEFLAIATGLAKDLVRLSALRSSLRQRLEQSPLMDAKKFTRHLESCYRRMWKEWCQLA